MFSNLRIKNFTNKKEMEKQFYLKTAFTLTVIYPGFFAGKHSV
jgi:hypothetical protein